MKIFRAFIVAVLAAVMIGASGPEQCLMREDGSMAFKRQDQDVRIKGLETPADGGTVFNDQPTFKAGVNIEATDSKVSDMVGRIPVVGPSLNYSSQIINGVAYYASVDLAETELGPTRAARIECFGQISGANADKRILVGIQADGDVVELMSITIPDTYEGYWSASLMLTHRGDSLPEDWYCSLEVRTADGNYFNFDDAVELPDSPLSIRLGIESQDAGDTIIQHQAVTLKVPY